MDVDVSLLLSVLVGTVIPILNGVIMRWDSQPAMQWVAGTVLAAVAGVATHVLAEGTGDIRAVLISAGTALVAAIATHFGVWRPTGAWDAVLHHAGAGRKPVGR